MLLLFILMPYRCHHESLTPRFCCIHFASSLISSAGGHVHSFHHTFHFASLGFVVLLRLSLCWVLCRLLKYCWCVPFLTLLSSNLFFYSRMHLIYSILLSHSHFICWYFRFFAFFWASFFAYYSSWFYFCEFTAIVSFYRSRCSHYYQSHFETWATAWGCLSWLEVRTGSEDSFYWSFQQSTRTRNCSYFSPHFFWWLSHIGGLRPSSWTKR